MCVSLSSIDKTDLGCFAGVRRQQRLYIESCFSTLRLQNRWTVICLWSLTASCQWLSRRYRIVFILSNLFLLVRKSVNQSAWSIKAEDKITCTHTSICHAVISKYWHTVPHTLRAQELCESRGGRAGLPVPNKPYGLCGRHAIPNLNPGTPACHKLNQPSYRWVTRVKACTHNFTS